MTRKSVSKKTTPPGFLERYSYLFTFERILVGIIIISTLAVVGGVALNAWNNRVVEIEGIQQQRGLSGGHDVNVSYQGRTIPPMGGIHHPTWQNCGIYTEPIGTQYALHSLEHGAVWIAYHPDLPADQVEKLQSYVRGGSHRLLSPYPGLESPIVLTAWGLQLSVENADDPRIADFIRNYEQGAQTPEPGALCSQGVGNPVG
jgi:hypothetical protein